jgi:hypothetical protein
LARVAQAVPGGEAHRAKMGDVPAGHALQGLMDPTVSWGTLGAHLAAAKCARGARWRGVTLSPAANSRAARSLASKQALIASG